MKQLNNLRELQDVGIYIYKDLLKFCSEHGLKVYLLAGSLLGAIRHNGFIPWDDDIDVGMSRPDYVRLLKLAQEGWISNKCRVIDPQTDKTYKGYIPVVVYEESYLRSAQFKEDENLKISISIFVFDGVPTSGFKRKIYFKHMYFLRAEHALCRADFNHVNTKFAREVGPILSKFYNAGNVYKFKNKIIKFSQKYAFEASKFCAPTSDCGAIKEVLTLADLEKSTTALFEGVEAPIMESHRQYLESYYGDYMTLPPEEERSPKHKVVAEIEDSYKFMFA